MAPEHNNHYYLNEAGCGAVPSCVWSSSGPHPAALALRTRHGMTLGRRYAGTLDFGRTGNRLYLGLRHEGQDGSTVVLRNLGMSAAPMKLKVRGGEVVQVIDSFGNEQTVSIQGSVASVVVGQMSAYVRLAKGQTVEVSALDFGRNIAPQAPVTTDRLRRVVRRTTCGFVPDDRSRAWGSRDGRLWVQYERASE